MRSLSSSLVQTIVQFSKALAPLQSIRRRMGRLVEKLALHATGDQAVEVANFGKAVADLQTQVLNLQVQAHLRSQGPVLCDLSRELASLDKCVPT
jgi:hypothetical protein